MTAPHAPAGPPGPVLVVGFAVTGQAAAAALRARGDAVVAVDDRQASAEMTEYAAALGVELVTGLSRSELAELAERARLVVLSPGVPPSHAIFAVAAPEKLVSEIELAFSLCNVPVVAITGTNGKTTVTSLVGAMLEASGHHVAVAGNIGRAFVEAVGTPGAELFVVEVSSFQLARTRTFRPAVAAWLNFAEDHLDWHGDLESYAAAKARVWANQAPGDVAVVNLDDPVVMRWAAGTRARVVTFGRSSGDFHERDGVLVGPDGPICAVSELARSLPHDRANALAAAAVAISAGATVAGVAAALRAGVPMPHRIELVATHDGVSYYDDSKATTPAAVAAALSAFDSVVLIAGGRNKGLDLSAMATQLGEAGHHTVLRGVVAIGESAPEIAAAFSGIPEAGVVEASSMEAAVSAAAALARPGDAVLLSPGCASFDWYRDYAARGDDFAEIVRRHVLDEAARTPAGSAQRRASSSRRGKS